MQMIITIFNMSWPKTSWKKKLLTFLNDTVAETKKKEFCSTHELEKISRGSLE